MLIGGLSLLSWLALIGAALAVPSLFRLAAWPPLAAPPDHPREIQHTVTQSPLRSDAELNGIERLLSGVI